MIIVEQATLDPSFYFRLIKEQLLPNFDLSAREKLLESFVFCAVLATCYVGVFLGNPILEKIYKWDAGVVRRRKKCKM